MPASPGLDASPSPGICFGGGKLNINPNFIDFQKKNKKVDEMDFLPNPLLLLAVCLHQRIAQLLTMVAAQLPSAATKFYLGYMLGSKPDYKPDSRPSLSLHADDTPHPRCRNLGPTPDRAAAN
jgi:hypothetical protein